MRAAAFLLLLSPAAWAADDLDRAIGLFKDGDVPGAMAVLSAMEHSEDASIFLSDIYLRVFGDKANAARLLEPWVGATERASVRRAAITGDLTADESKLDCPECGYSDRSVDPFYFRLAQAGVGGDLDAKLELARVFLFTGGDHLVDGEVLGLDYGRGYDLLLEMADAGDPRGMYWVSGLLSRPRGANFKGIPRDRELGLSYLRTAAELGFGPAIEALDQYDVRDEDKKD